MLSKHLLPSPRPAANQHGSSDAARHTQVLLLHVAQKLQSYFLGLV